MTDDQRRPEKIILRDIEDGELTSPVGGDKITIGIGSDIVDDDG